MVKNRHFQFLGTVHIIILFLFAIAVSSDAVDAKSLNNKEWLSEANRNAPIYLNINGEKLELDSDIQKIVSYYQTKSPDEFLWVPFTA